MKINSKQFNYLTTLLKNYELKKDIDILTPYEASVAIEGILNDGKVKKTYKNKLLSDSMYIEKQKLFNRLIEKKNIYSTEKQLNFIINLCIPSKYELINNKILKEDASPLIKLLKDKVINNNALKYLKEYTDEEKALLIKVNTPKPLKQLALPNEWALYNQKINGIIDFL